VSSTFAQSHKNSFTQVVKSGSAGRRTAFSHRGGIQHIPTQYGAIECSVWESAHSKVTNLQGFPTFASSCTAPDPEPQPIGLEPVDGSGRLLFAPASSVRSRPKSERRRVGGLRTTPCGFLRFPHANPKPDRPLGQSCRRGNKKAVTTALGRNPSVKTKGEGMCNGSHLSLPTATI
jgi:hypothetical protein